MASGVGVTGAISRYQRCAKEANPNGGLRNFHQKSTCLHAITFRSLCGEIISTVWIASMGRNAWHQQSFQLRMNRESAWRYFLEALFRDSAETPNQGSGCSLIGHSRNPSYPFVWMEYLFGTLFGDFAETPCRVARPLSLRAPSGEGLVFRAASEQSGNSSKRSKDFYLKAKARIWP